MLWENVALRDRGLVRNAQENIDILRNELVRYAKGKYRNAQNRTSKRCYRNI